MKRVALYMRVSTDQQAKHGDSLREQQDTLYDYVKSQRDLKVVGEYVDGGISGQKLNRDEFQNLLEEVKKDKIDIILFTKLDRWFRNLRHYLNIQDILEKHNVSWNAVSQQYYDTTTAYGRTFIAQVMSFAELEAQIDSERIKAVMANKIAQGEVVSGKIPIGYSIEDKKLVKNSDAPIIEDIFNHYLQYSSMHKTVQYLETQYGIIRDYQSVKNMLTNEKYIGRHRGNDSYCPAIVAKDKFSMVQHMLSKNLKYNTKRTYIFRGLVKCAHCEGSMSGQYISRRYTKKDNSVSVYERRCYRCAKRRNNTLRCNNKRIVYENQLEQYILNQTRNVLAQTRIDFDKDRNKQKPKLDNKRKIEVKLDRLKKAYLNEIIELEEYKEDRQKLINELESIKIIPMPTNTKMIDFFLSDEFLEIYNNSTAEDKQSIWRSVIDKIEIDKDGNIDVSFLI